VGGRGEGVRIEQHGSSIGGRGRVRRSTAAVKGEDSLLTGARCAAGSRG
jgi:hypothetical protein